MLLLILSGCSTPRFIGSHSFHTSCLSDRLDGVVVLKSWGEGVSTSEALLNAQKVAIENLLFHGIIDGAVLLKPMVNEVNVQQEHREYFRSFFSKRGPFKDFVSITGQKKDLFRSQEGFVTGVVLELKRDALRSKLVEDGIIK
ncbi:hypothetical protein K5X82_05730 [Halosquirtibacter xylanolyticus]|uniref:hypothetical protein n=1 Tax=Halosquirtibacter xylanolyticus TaxID=3374599 RepID=UPI003749EE93|nr:hypothetical protein K5X82_05730 [Prolixibacteraceae bacterium]